MIIDFQTCSRGLLVKRWPNLPTCFNISSHCPPPTFGKMRANAFHHYFKIVGYELLFILAEYWLTKLVVYFVEQEFPLSPHISFTLADYWLTKLVVYFHCMPFPVSPAFYHISPELVEHVLMPFIITSKLLAENVSLWLKIMDLQTTSYGYFGKRNPHEHICFNTSPHSPAPTVALTRANAFRYSLKLVGWKP